MIGLLLQLLQQVKYEDVDTFEQVILIAEKKKSSLGSTPIVSQKAVADIHGKPMEISSSSSVLYRPIDSTSWMEVDMKQLVSQIS